MPLSRIDRQIEEYKGTKIGEVLEEVRRTQDKLNEAIDAVNKLAAYSRIVVGPPVPTQTQQGTTNYTFSQGGIIRHNYAEPPVADGDQQLKQDDGKAGSD